MLKNNISELKFQNSTASTNVAVSIKIQSNFPFANIEEEKNPHVRFIIHQHQLPNCMPVLFHTHIIWILCFSFVCNLMVLTV